MNPLMWHRMFFFSFMFFSSIHFSLFSSIPFFVIFWIGLILKREHSIWFKTTTRIHSETISDLWWGNLSCNETGMKTKIHIIDKNGEKTKYLKTTAIKRNIDQGMNNKYIWCYKCKRTWHVQPHYWAFTKTAKCYYCYRLSVSQARRHHHSLLRNK